ncbi:hypothetical protein EG327_006116 [Venturia inaequalis]|uniref:DUF7730 domain-containing protein n=1 Tax=Venturia inaequalis TaxID=5025 RepID=A0A8H3Z121_VENIN|nr:hypothetical protein EG327_006116 [Venturia inaequalis]
MPNWNDLPLELREKVYHNLWRLEDTLVVPKAIYIERATKTLSVRTRSQVKKNLDAASPHNPWKRRAHIISASSRFLRCSKQVYSEGLKILYSNRFTAYHLDSFPAFATKVGPFSFSHIRNLELHDAYFSEANEANQFDGLVHLETLTYHKSCSDETRIRPFPAHVPNDASDPIQRTRSLRPRHLANDFLRAMASRHLNAKITIEFKLYVIETHFMVFQGQVRMRNREEVWDAKYTVNCVENGLDVVYVPNSRNFIL